MQGKLLYYKGIVAGYKKLHGIIEGNDLVCYKNEKMQEKDECLRVTLEKEDGKIEVVSDTKEI